MTVDLAKAEGQQLIRDLQNKTDVGVEKALVQIAGAAETSPINKDVLFIEKNSIPDGGRRGILESES